MYPDAAALIKGDYFKATHKKKPTPSNRRWPKTFKHTPGRNQLPGAPDYGNSAPVL